MVRSPLHVAIADGDLDIFRTLLSRGADPNAPSADRTPLAEAVGRGHRTMVKELLDHGADPNLDRSSAVVSAAAVGYITEMLMLIEHGADIHIQEGVPGKALHLAARYTHLDMVKLLLEKGVDVNAFGGEYGYEFPLCTFGFLLT
jgi:ankyrin repeat protein